MKQLVCSLLILAYASSGFSAPTSEELWDSYARTANRIMRTYAELGVGEVIKGQKINQDEVWNEVITKVNHSSSSSSKGYDAGGTLDLFYFSLGAERHEKYSTQSYSRTYETSRIPENPDEIENFSNEKSEKLNRLKMKLRDYLDRNGLKLVQMKEDAVRLMMISYELVKLDEEVAVPELQKVINTVMSISFLGVQNVSHCTTVNTPYINQVNNNTNTNESSNFSFNFFGAFKGNEDSAKSSSYDDHWERMAGTSKSCDSSTNHISVNGSDSIYKINFSMLDRKLAQWIKSIDFLIYVKQSNKTKMFPTFGSPYYGGYDRCATSSCNR